MQVVAERPSPKVIVLPMRMSMPASLPQPETPQGGYHPTTHGNWAQWTAIIVALLIGLATLGTTLWFHFTAQQSLVADEHVNGLVDAKLNPAVKEMSKSLGGRLSGIDHKLNDMDQRLSRLEGRFQQQDAEQKKIAAQLERQESLARLINPSRLLATIRAELQVAQANGRILPASDLADYRNAMRELPASAYEYWSTVAAIINYQSLLNQMSGEAPNPSKISRPCGMVTTGDGLFSEGNVIVHQVISECVVDLDTEVFQDVTFKDSVIRYHGGPTILDKVTFINCTFLLDLKASQSPTHPEVLRSLLDSDQKKVTLSTRS